MNTNATDLCHELIALWPGTILAVFDFFCVKMKPLKWIHGHDIQNKNVFQFKRDDIGEEH